MKKDCTIRSAKTKALISFAVTAKLICAFVFAYANCRFSHAAAQYKMRLSWRNRKLMTVVNVVVISLLYMLLLYI